MDHAGSGVVRAGPGMAHAGSGPAHAGGVLVFGSVTLRSAASAVARGIVAGAAVVAGAIRILGARGYGALPARATFDIDNSEATRLGNGQLPIVGRYKCGAHHDMRRGDVQQIQAARQQSGGVQS